MPPRLSIIIASSHEPKTIQQALKAFLQQIQKTDAEVLVVAPDEQTLSVVRKFSQTDHRVQWIQDAGRGKPTALNLALQKATGDILIFSDGDVEVAPDALSFLLQPFNNADCGAATGCPVPKNPRNTKFGYWAHVLTSAADTLRLQKDARGEPLEASGYLVAVKRDLLTPLPEDTLADDPVMTSMVLNAGKRMRYAPEARVFVQFPTNYHDWFAQKMRTCGGYLQPYVTQEKKRMRSFWRELRHGFLVLRYAKNAREVFWTGELFMARLFAWMGAFYNIRLQKKSLQEIWKPVATTK